MSNKKKIILVAVVLAIVFFATLKLTKQSAKNEELKAREALKVTTQSVSDSQTLTRNIEYPAMIASDQQATVNAATAGTITQLNFDLGTQISSGQQLAVIDEVGNNSENGDHNLKSASVQALELAIQSAEEKYQSAKRSYQDNKTYANKKAKEVAEIEWQTAKVNLKGALNNRLVTAPISGLAIQKTVSLGDSVSVGQTIAIIAKTALTKAQFYVDKSDLESFKIGSPVTICEDGKSFSGTVSRISPVADITTHRFLVEARPKDGSSLTVGTLVSVSFSVKMTPIDPKDSILPLSAITIGQNENYIFMAKDGHAKKIQVEIKKVTGEYAEVKTGLDSQDLVILSGSKLVQDGDAINLN